MHSRPVDPARDVDAVAAYALKGRASIVVGVRAPTGIGSSSPTPAAVRKTFIAGNIANRCDGAHNPTTPASPHRSSPNRTREMPKRRLAAIASGCG